MLDSARQSTGCPSGSKKKIAILYAPKRPGGKEPVVSVERNSYAIGNDLEDLLHSRRTAQPLNATTMIIQAMKNAVNPTVTVNTNMASTLRNSIAWIMSLVWMS
jgi:hypothetical protein